MAEIKLPSWKDIPAIPGMPPGTAWGLFDTHLPDGTVVKDNLGTINLLTPSVILSASSEIKCGKSVSLNWGLEKLHCPGFARQVLVHEFVDWRSKKPEEGGGSWSFDDVVTVNTQTGSQWDGLRHWGHSKNGMYYNGLHHHEVLASGKLGIEHYTKHGGIVGRGVLLDSLSYAERHGIEYSPMSKHGITVSDLEAIGNEEGITFKEGDILIVRTGWTKWYDEHSEEERLRYITNGSEWVGVEGSKETVEWLWNHHFAAVAGDNIGFEVWPTDPDYRLHDYLLSMWGMPIGEMWDLEGLAAECVRQNRWSFFLTSSPLNTTGGVASPPNAIAVF